VTPLDNVLHRLHTLGKCPSIEPTGDIGSYSYSYMGRLVKQRVTVSPVMKKKTLVRVAKGAISGSITDMATVAMLYATGYGLPKDGDLAESWALFSTISQASIHFDDACALLKKHAMQNDEEIWPLDLTLPIARMAERLATFKPYKGGDTMAGASIFPRFAGVRVFLLYRQGEEGVPHLYAGYYKDGDDILLEIDALIRLGVPRYLGEVRGKCIIDSYTPFGKKHSLIVVVGTIAVPISAMRKARQFGNSTKAVFKAFLADASPRKIEAAFDNSFYVEKLAELRKQVRRLRGRLKTVKGTRRLVVSEKYERLRDSYIELKALVEKSNPKLEYANYLETLPETYLRMVMQELYLWEDGMFVAAPIPPSQTPDHLSSLGFTSLRMRNLEFLSYSCESRLTDERLAEVAKKFEVCLGFKVTGLVIQPKIVGAPLRLRSCRSFNL
jgi:hypothetical protein